MNLVILQALDLQRFILIYVVQLTVCLIFFMIAVKILKRNRNTLTYTLSAFYFTIFIGLVVNAIYIPIEANPTVHILYLITMFCILFAFFFLVLFNLFLYKLDTKVSRSNIVVMFVFYVSITLTIILIPNGFAINKQTNWKPVWTWTFLIIVYLYLFIFAIIPFAVLFIKIYKTFGEKSLKRRIKYFYVGFIGMIIAMLGGMLYNTWNNAVFRMIWTGIVLFITVPSGVLIYYGIAQKL